MEHEVQVPYVHYSNVQPKPFAVCSKIIQNLVSAYLSKTITSKMNKRINVLGIDQLHTVIAGRGACEQASCRSPEHIPSRSFY